MRPIAALLLSLSSLSCADKAFVSAIGGGSDAHLAVVVSLGELGAQSDITAVRIIASYTAGGNRVVLRDVTVPYRQGESRDVALSLDIGACLLAGGGVGGAATCPVLVSVEVLADTRVLARDDLPVVPLRAGESVSTPALAARSATSVRLRYNNANAPGTLPLAVGGSAMLTAEPLDAGAVLIAGRTIAWSSSAPAVASVSAAGVVTALAPGDATIIASTGSGAAQVRSSTVINVAAPAAAASVQLAPTTATIVVGALQALTPTARDAAGVLLTVLPALTWSSSAPTIATVSSAGVVTGLASGSATITARTAAGVAGTATITVFAVPAAVGLSPATASLAVGGTQALTPTVRDAAGAQITPPPTLQWSTSEPAVATVSSAGIVTAAGAGTATISARTTNGITGTATITVGAVPATLQIAPSSATVAVAGTQALVATVRDAAGVAITPTPALTWSSSLQTVATVSATGVVTGVAAGTATITARTSSGITGTTAVTVTAVPARVVLSPASPTLAAGATTTLVPTVSDGTGTAIAPTPSLAWATSAPGVATVSQTGVVTAVAPGTTIITARTANGIEGTATVTVSVVSVPATVQLAPTSFALALSATQLVTATVRDAAGNPITPAPVLAWQSTNPSVASVSSTGLVTGLAPGFASISARTSNDVVATATVTVGESGSFSGRVFAFENDSGIAGATVTISVVAGVVRSVTTDAQGNYATGTLFGGPFTLRVSANGFVATDIRNVVLNGAQTLEAVPLSRATSGNGVVSGTLYNATNNLPILSVATVDLYAGMSSTTGAPVASTTAQQGSYQFLVPAGTYTVLARASGYSAATRTVSGFGGQRNATGQNIVLSPTSAVGSLRVVLTWGGTPADLDSHLVGPGVNQSTFWVFWETPGSCTTAPFSCLDVDATDGQGPETITIAQRTPGRYVYSVHNFSAGPNSAFNSDLSRSNARVDIYSSAGLIQSYAVPARAGTLWTVFEWDGVTIRPINTVTGDAPPARDRAPGSVLGESSHPRVKAKR